MEYTIFALYLTLIIAFFYSSRNGWLKGIPIWLLISLFALRLSVGVSIQHLYYSLYGGGDLFSFFNDALILKKHFSASPSTFITILCGINLTGIDTHAITNELSSWGWGLNEIGHISNRVMIRLNYLFSFISSESLLVHTLFFSTFSFIGSVYLFKGISNLVPKHSKITLIVLLLFPSTLMWTTTGFKESVLLLLLGIIIYHLILLFKKKGKSYSYILLVVCLLACMVFRPYVGLTLSISSISILIAMQLKAFRSLAFICSYLILGCLIYISINRFSNTHIPTLIYEQQQQGINISKGGLYLHANEKVVVIPYDSISNSAIKVNTNLYRLIPKKQYTYLPLGDFDTRKTFTNPAGDKSLYRNVRLSKPVKKTLEMSYLEDRTTISLIKVLPHSILTPLISPINYLFNYKTVVPYLEQVFILFLFLLAFLFRSKTNAFVASYFLVTSLSVLCIVGMSCITYGSMVRLKTPATLFMVMGVILLFDFDKFKIFIGKLKAS